MSLLHLCILTAVLRASAAHPFVCPIVDSAESDVEVNRGPSEKLCGVADVQHSNTHDVIPHSWPWLVSLQYRKFITGTNWKPECTGILVSSTEVIVHDGCVGEERGKNVFDWLMVLGAHNVSVFENIHTSVPSVSYTWSMYAGFFTLSKSFPENPFIDSICVRQERFPVGYAECFVAGWPNTAWNVLKEMKNMTQARMRIVSKFEYENETGKILNNVDIAATPVVDSDLANFGPAASWLYSRPLMCRNWCSGSPAQWYLEGYADGMAENLSKTKTYVTFYTRTNK